MPISQGILTAFKWTRLLGHTVVDLRERLRDGFPGRRGQEGGAHQLAVAHPIGGQTLYQNTLRARKGISENNFKFFEEMNPALALV